MKNSPAGISGRAKTRTESPNRGKPSAGFPFYNCFMLLSPAQVKHKLLSPLKRNWTRVAHNRDYLRIRVRVRRLGRLLIAIPWVGLVYRTVREMGADDATHMAAGVAYYFILSLFPLTIALISLLSMVLESEIVEQEVFRFFQTYLPGSDELLATNVEAVGNIRGFLGVVSFLGLFWSASLLFGAVSRAVNRAWDVHDDRPFYIDKLRHIIMTLAVAPLFLLSVSATAALQVLGSIDLPLVGHLALLEHNGINLLTRPLPFVFSLTIFLLIYKFTPNTKTHWRYVWAGALLAAVLFEVAKSAFILYLENFADYQKVYGSLGSVIALLAWAYISAFILILGAEFASEYERMRLGIKRGQPNMARRYRQQRPPPGED